MNEQNVVLITGMSGAGKTTAMGILEDMGYHCIDNVPVQLLESLGKIINAKPETPSPDDDVFQGEYAGGGYRGGT